jgi:DNA-binding winged helix-turn-helix (wHTH) protein/tetratricopeptide (TPR) repeat protein
MSLSRIGLYRFDEFVVDRLKRTLVRGDVPVPLSPKPFEVLSYLVENPGRVITKEELLKAIWPESFVEEGNLAQHIAALRKAFADRAGYIVTIPGSGYQFAAEVHHNAFVPIHQPDSFLTQTVRERTRIIVQESSGGSGDVPATRAALHGRTRNRIWIPVAIAAVLATGLGGWFAWNRMRWTPTGEHLDIVLADFDNRTGEEVFDVVLKNAVEIDLEQSPLLSIVPLSRTRSTMQQMGHGPQDRQTPELAREVCERNSAQAMLSGSITKLGNSYVITLDAMDCVSGKKLARLESQARNQDEILQTVDGIASKMRRKLGESAHSIQGFDVPIQQSTTPSFEALVAYSRGIIAPDADAVQYFERAIQLDPNFAMAYEKLGAANGNRGNIATTRQLFKKAYELRKSTSIAEQFMITSRYYEIVEDNLDLAAKNYELWTRSYPLDVLVWATLANTYTQMGRYPEAIQAGERARSIDPNSKFMFVVLARAYKRASQFAQAEAVCKDAIARGKDTWGVHSILLQIAVAEHDEVGIARENAWDKGKPTENQTLENAAFVEATAGRLQHAKELFREAQALTAKDESADFAFQLDSDEAEVDRLLGAPAASRVMAAKVPIDQDDISFVAGFSAALTGDIAYARRVIEEQTRTAPANSTLVQKVQVPLVNAAIALREGKPERAVALVEPANVYRAREYYVPTLLGEAYLEMHQATEAAVQFQDIIANPGIDPASPMYPLAHLGLARSYAMQNKIPDSLKEYDAFFFLWKDADADLSVMKEARLEDLRLRARQSAP